MFGLSPDEMTGLAFLGGLLFGAALGLWVGKEIYKPKGN